MAKVTRDAFLYLSPRTIQRDKFAQCGACNLFDDAARRCGVLGDEVEVLARMSCGFYEPGTPHPQPHQRFFTPEEVGLVDRQVRCENCEFGGTVCGLYERLNESLPAVFNLDVNIEPEACCNAQLPKRSKPERSVDARLDAAVRIMGRVLARADAVVAMRTGGQYPVKLELELTNWDGLTQLVAFLQYVRAAANAGHSFSLEADREEGAMPEFMRKFGLSGPHPRVGVDGDGSDHIGRILLNGEEIK